MNKMENILIARPTNAKQLNIITAFFEALKINFEVTNESPYDKKFVAKIQLSRQQAKEGKTVKIPLDDIWK